MARAGRSQHHAKMVKSDADTVEFSQQQNMIAAFYTYMALFAVPVQQSLLRDSITSGPFALIDLAEQDMKQATETMRYMISTQTFGDGTDRRWLGLAGILPSTGVGTNTVYGVAEASRCSGGTTSSRRQVRSPRTVCTVRPTTRSRVRISSARTTARKRRTSSSAIARLWSTTSVRSV
jgi:hypothetical protein